MSGARAYSLNALTICFMASTCATMVLVARSRIWASCSFMLPRNLRRIRSADSWMGVSGFLISCAKRRAARIVRQGRTCAHQHMLARLGQQFDLFTPVELPRLQPLLDGAQELGEQG